MMENRQFSLIVFNQHQVPQFKVIHPVDLVHNLSIQIILLSQLLHKQ
ncbi:unnamed protein product [Schistosoma curassoni]|uniref:Uncharacterized protein n=1 Tax=Schistosoma curassoni TaxID=6186 RepID=A0A183KWC2_9TREM|nr:unnamed protein product [Schistosoma curassoni]